MALVSGYARDIVDLPLPPGSWLLFTPHAPATMGTRLISGKPVEVTPAANGWFEVNLPPTRLTSPPMKFTVSIVYSTFEQMDLIAGLEVPEVGGSIANLSAASTELVIWSPTQPLNMTVGQVWIDTITGDVKQEDGTP